MDIKVLMLEHKKVIDELMNNCIQDIEKVAKACCDAIKGGKTIYWCGNGGSAADCQHIAAEFVGRFLVERKGLSSVALTTDTSILTAVSNDYGYENVFKRQVEALVKNGDILVGLSGSGNSKNVFLAIEEAKKQGAITISFGGKEKGLIGHVSDLSICVPSRTTARIQECHILIGHMICEYIDEIYK